MKIKLAFFDIDGTLSVPTYKNGDKMVIGFSVEGWKDHCITNKENAYEFCRIVKPVRRYAQQLLKEGVKLYALTVCSTPEETLAKECFIKKHCDGMFNKVIAVESDGQKVEAIKKYAFENDVALSECELVEDTFSTLLAVMQEGIKPTHVSSLVAEL